MRLPLERFRSVAVVLALCVLAPLGGCVYHMTIEQGNFLRKQDIDQLKVGMTESQVRYLLGTPMVPTTFDNNRWDYLYYIKRGYFGKPVRYLLTVYFHNNKIVRINTHGYAPINSEPAVISPPVRTIG